ncbi:MAG: gamma-glutamyltransferase [Thiomicrorhabdus chilensis]|uniref:gamma-glutamyltransferase n=1 Tax=Thiomicrorhabdus chilensis TaxID=63656 RepID=UPI00299EAF65|nr:gamma-glutamyltransferase [Thiomicrorhabdus chilensis]MDX1346651.1 gamma-glutamyltransferase [Thiomicrorhabdus chilensis]
MLKKSFLSLLALLALLISLSVSARPAAVAMPDQYSADVAQSIMQQGGNAVDAAVAAGFVLAVTYPEAGNLGGGGFMTLYTRPADSQKGDITSQTYFLDYREKAPKAAHRDMYLDKEGKVIPYRSLVGYQASGVPGTVMGFWQVHQSFGSLPWRTLMQPAIDLAEQGFEVSEHLQNTAQWFQSWIADKSPTPLNFTHYFGKLMAGKVFKQPELGKTLRRIAELGPQDFYQGETARKLVAEMQANEGLITLDDLKSYQAVWRDPVVGEWQGRRIVSAPPPSSGGVAIVQLLKMKQHLQGKLDAALKQTEKDGVPQQAVKTHFYAELEKRVYADRAFYLGDPDFVEVPVAKLISDVYLKERSTTVLLDEISVSEEIHPGKLESPETTHFSIIDSDGNAVSNTYTLNMPFGSGVVIPGAGFLMNDEMDDFSTKPGVANVFGVVGGKANEVAPEKRMLSSMSPTIVLKGGEVEMVVGTPGGSTIITSVFQTIINVVDEGLSAQQAVDAPRVHHQLLPKDQIAYHPDLPEAVKEELQALGYTLKRNNYMGDVQLILRQDGELSAAADRRGRGLAKVFEISTP